MKCKNRPFIMGHPLINVYIYIHYLGHQREFPFFKSDVKICQYMKDAIITKSEQFSSLEKDYPRVHQLITCLSIDIKLPQRISINHLRVPPPLFLRYNFEKNFFFVFVFYEEAMCWSFV